MIKVTFHFEIEWKTVRITMFRIFQWMDGLCKPNAKVRRQKSIQKSRTVRITTRVLSCKVNDFSKIVWNGKIYRVHQVYQIHQNRLSTPCDENNKDSIEKYKCRDVWWKNITYVRWNSIKNCAKRRGQWSLEDKEIRHWMKHSYSKT